MKNRKALVISIAVLIALLCIGSASAVDQGGWARGSGGIAPGEYHPRQWGSPRERELRKVIGKNTIRIRQLEETLEQSKSTRLSPGAMGDIRRELNQLKRNNRRFQRELDDLKRQGPPRIQQPPRLPRN